MAFSLNVGKHPCALLLIIVYSLPYVINRRIADGQVLNGLAKRWLRELKENSEELMAHFLFQRSIAGSINRICCRLCKSINQIMDGYSLCEVYLTYRAV